jgi:hypothetical protein
MFQSYIMELYSVYIQYTVLIHSEKGGGGSANQREG